MSETLTIVARRLAQQQLTGPRAASVAEAVRHSLAVQAQDPPLSRWSLGMRVGCDDAQVRDAIDSGEVVRTHVLRPTWHYVHRDDLRWLLELTAPKVISGMGARHRQLGIGDDVWAEAASAFEEALADGPLTRKQLQPHLPVTDFPQHGQVVGHLLLLAELRGVICSGPLTDKAEHTYALLDSVVEPADPVPHEQAVERLVRGFVRGHGPTSIRDLQRWCTVTKREAQAVFAHPDFAHEVVDEVELWSLPDAELPVPDDEHEALGGLLLLPTFDGAYLSHDRPRFPRREGHRLGELHVHAAEAGHGVVVMDGVDVGGFKRVKLTRRTGPSVEVRLELVDDLAEVHAERLSLATQEMVDFFA